MRSNASPLRRSLLRAVAIAAAAGVAGCGSVREPAAPSVPVAAAQVWQYPASEYPAMCLVLEPGGSARFVGGFLYFNPSSWRHDAVSGLTVLGIGGGALPLPPAQSPTASGTTAAGRIDSARRTVDYRIEAKTRAIDFGGFVFFRTDRCSVS